MDGSDGRAATGIAGLDEVLIGGFVRDHTYLVEGTPGAGKTTVGLQFLLEGARAGERCLYVTLSETVQELELVAVSHGWSLAGIDVFEPFAPRACSTPASSKACSIRPTWSSARRRAPSSSASSS